MTSARGDLELVDALCRLSVAARRCGRTLRVMTDDEQLISLISLIGLTDPLMAGGSRQVQWQTQAGEDRVAEEGVDVGDPPA